MVNKPLCVRLYWHSCKISFWDVSFIQWREKMHYKLAGYLIVYNCEKYKYEAIYTQNQFKRKYLNS